MVCDICGSTGSVNKCENCGKNYCNSCSGASVGVEDSLFCKKCVLKTHKVRCKKCGNKFTSQEELEKHYLKHPVHRTQF